MICRDCGLQNVAFKKNPCHKNKGICMKCHSIYTQNLNMDKLAKRSPHLYFSCDNCDRTFSIYKSGGGFYRKKNTACIYCKSEEIATIEEQSFEGKKSEYKE